MSEKATLLTSIPPVKKTEAKDSNITLLTSNSAAPKAEPPKTEKISLLSQTRDVEPAPTLAPNPTLTLNSAPKTEDVKSPLLQTIDDIKTVEAVASEAVASEAIATEAIATEAIATEAVAEDSSSITAFQAVTYASFFLNFLLAGAAAVILFKKAAKLAEERFTVSTKALAIAGVLIMLHGFFATYLYSAHLSDSVSSAPLFLTMAVWVLIGPVVGFIIRNLLARQDKPNLKAAFIDAGVYGVIFFFTACGVSSSIKTNAALMFAVLAGFIMIVPIARSLSAFKVAKARHEELNETSDQILIYGLLLIPALLPILAFANVCGLSDSVTLFLINFITFDFMLLTGLAMIASADELIPEGAVQAAEAEVAEEVTGVQIPEPAAVEVNAPEQEPVTETFETPATPAPNIEKIGTGNPDDPIIQFLNSEEGMAEKPTSPEAPAKPAANSAPRTLPPRKPGRPGLKPPAKPGSTPASSQAPNAPSRLKAPAKPKKRF